MVSHVLDVHDDHEPIYDDLLAVHHPLPSDLHALSNHLPVFPEHLLVSANHDSFFIVDEDILSTNHHPVHHHHPLCVVHHSIFNDYPLFEAKLYVLPDLYTLLVLDSVPVRARRR